MTYDEIVSLLNGVKGKTALCPAHPDKQRSLSHDYKDGKILLHCHAGCSIEKITAALGISAGDLFEGKKGTSGMDIVAKYDYHDPEGKLIYQVVRLSPKSFRQRRPDGAGGWIWNMKDVKSLPYRLPELIKGLARGDTVFITEGEKDVDALAAMGLTATSNHGGAGKWSRSLDEHFPVGAEVVILPDNDDPGRDHARKVVKQLTDRGCNVRVVELPGLPEKGDVSDWLTAGGTRDELLRLATEEKQDQWPEPEEITSELLPVEALPAEIIPGAFRPWLVDIARRMQCPLDFVAVGALVVSAAVIGAGCAMRPKQRDDWNVIPNLWGGVVARPSMLKSPALAEIMKPLVRMELEARDEYDEAMMMHGAEFEAYKAERESIKADMLKTAKGKGTRNMDVLKAEFMGTQEPEAPTRRRFKTNDSTIEKLGELLNENPRGILVFRDELVGLLSNWDREDRQVDRAFYLEGWNGNQGHTVDRIGRGTIDVTNTCISILGGIQPAKLQAYLMQSTGNLTNDGMMQRFQLLIYPDEPGNWQLVDEWPAKEAKNRAHEIIKAMANMDFIGAGATNGTARPYFNFSEQGQAVFNEWLTELEAKIRQETNPLISEHLAKYRSLMPSIALVLHLVDAAGDGWPGPVSDEAATKAAAWCEYFETHARRIYGLLGDKGSRAAAELGARIKAGKVEDGFTIRDIYNRKQWHLLDTKELVLEACQELVEAGWLRRDDIASTGGRPKEVYHINPKVFS